MSRFPNPIPTPASLKARSLVYDLKARLDWGEPALTIIDVRDRNLFNISHIMGAISLPLNELVDRARTSLEFTRDLYVYGEIDEETAEAAAKLRAAGYINVSELRGGLAAWKAVGFPVEAIPYAAIK
ncbi:rhodanese-like domain-containing protein [Aerosakkonema funiforme]|uniref:Rhodanese-like domain-containing protein n=1 Tax=Aerosakkonema funiforme FACHB-1375 TaxID=2949571 RepID=A0A926VJV6_9CYAN|nr:rhodanese-like domain-containing protein [Aerosakkonema funiforme]MBD2184578.1 rhodanese-like domain-containing protein [Aerosakkonema funiforme FACHB-1375]